jgi:hypothetical protein
VILLGSAATAISLAEAIVLARLGNAVAFLVWVSWLWNIDLSFDNEGGCRDGCYQGSRFDQI